MRTKVTLVLLFLNAALFFYIFRFERAWRTELVATEVRHRVLGAEAANLTAIEVSSARPGESFRLERRGSRWMMTAPFEWPANPAAVDRIRTDLQLLDDETSFSVSEVEKNEQSLAVYGLDHPALTVNFVSGGPDITGSAPVATTLRIGSATKVGQRLYLLSPDGQRIHVIGRAIVDSLSLPLDQLRSDRVLTVPVYEARSLNLLAAGGPRVRIQRQGARWMFETPVPARASKGAVELAINGLEALRVKSFWPEQAGRAAPAALRITIEGNNQSETLFLEGEAPGTAAAGNQLCFAQLEDLNKPAGRSIPFVVEMPSELAKSLLNAADALRDPRVLDFDPAAVTAVTLHAPAAADVVLQRLEPGAGGAGWQMALPTEAGHSPRTPAADGAAVNHLLGELATLTMLDIKSDSPTDADREKWGLTQPERRITLALGGSTLALDIGRSNPRDPVVYGQVTNTLSVYTLSPEILRDTPVAPGEWRDRGLLALPATAKLVSATLTDLTTGKEAWAFGSAAQASTEVKARPEIALHPENLAHALRELHAVRFEPGAFSPAGGAPAPWRYRLDVTFALPGGGGSDSLSVHQLYLTDRIGGTEQWGGAAEFGAVFRLDQPLIDALWILTYGDRDPGEPAQPEKRR
jgi:hypothetical protein